MSFVFSSNQAAWRMREQERELRKERESELRKASPPPAPSPETAPTSKSPPKRRVSKKCRNKESQQFHAENVEGYIGDKPLSEIYEVLGVPDDQPADRSKSKKKAKRSKSNSKKEEKGKDSILLKLDNGREITLPAGRMSAMPKDQEGEGKPTVKIAREMSEGGRLMQKMWERFMRGNPVVYDGTNWNKTK